MKMDDHARLYAIYLHSWKSSTPGLELGQGTLDEDMIFPCISHQIFLQMDNGVALVMRILLIQLSLANRSSFFGNELQVHRNPILTKAGHPPCKKQ